MKTLALYTPYALVPGGGERYLLSIGEALRDIFRIFLITPGGTSVGRIAELGDSLGVHVRHLTPMAFEEVAPQFDVAVVLGNEAFPAMPPLGRRNIYVCQFPFDMPQSDMESRLPFVSQYQCVVVYSDYVRTNLLRQYAALGREPPPVRIVHPPVDRVSAAGHRRTRQRRAILSVGRFFAREHSKRQDALILALRGLLRQSDATLHLAGTVHVEAEHRAYYERCRELAQGLPVTFYPDASRQTIGNLYRECDCYWHGTGLDSDIEASPGNFEHFGISVVEAMAAGCIPFVLDKGAPAAMVVSGVNGWTYRSSEELVSLTARYFRRSGPARELFWRNAARLTAYRYRTASFRNKWRALCAE